jgi:translation initiation factor 5B
MMLCGLSQKYLGDKLALGKTGKGVVLEIKKEKDINYIESILYDGSLEKNDEIAVANLEGDPILTKVRVLEEIKPLSNKFQPKEKVMASTGLRIQLTGKVQILPGMPFQVYENNLEEIKEEFKKEISENIKTEKQGIIVKADSLGSLEALLLILGQNNISVVKAGIGMISKTDLISAKANLDINELDAIIIGFNTELDSEAKELEKSLKENKKIKILTDKVIYKLIENLVEFREEKIKEIEKARLLQLASLTKLKILKQYVFKNTNPAIFGVRVEAGKLLKRIELIDGEGETVGKVKNLQADNKSVEEANEGKELAISIPGINFERRMKAVEFVYSNISENQFRNFKKNKDLLSQSEIKVLQEIAEVKRKEKADWGI